MESPFLPAFAGQVSSSSSPTIQISSFHEPIPLVITGLFYISEQQAQQTHNNTPFRRDRSRQGLSCHAVIGILAFSFFIIPHFTVQENPLFSARLICFASAGGLSPCRTVSARNDPFHRRSNGSHARESSGTGNTPPMYSFLRDSLPAYRTALLYNRYGSGLHRKDLSCRKYGCAFRAKKRPMEQTPGLNWICFCIFLESRLFLQIMKTFLKLPFCIALLSPGCCRCGRS